MCRILAYLGAPVLLDELMYQPDSSLIRQTYNPKMLRMLNLAGFGMVAWDDASHSPEVPFSYGTTEVPVFDPYLKALCGKVEAKALLAHVRGVAYDHRVQVNRANLHPFQFADFPLALAHNGDLAEFDRMKYDLAPYMNPEVLKRIRGSTDSEWLYALTMSELEDPRERVDAHEIVRAVEGALRTVRKVREEHDIHRASAVNLFLCDGHSLVATRFTFDFGCYGERVHDANLSYLSLWYTTGREYGFHDGEWKMIGGATNSNSVIIASEPLTSDISTWIEVPEYSVVYVKGEGEQRKVRTIELDA